MCLSASGRLVVNNAYCRNWPGDVHLGNEQLCIIHSDADGQFSRWGSFFDVVDSLLLGLGVDHVVLGCSSGCLDFLILL